MFQSEIEAVFFPWAPEQPWQKVKGPHGWEGGNLFGQMMVSQEDSLSQQRAAETADPKDWIPLTPKCACKPPRIQT